MQNFLTQAIIYGAAFLLAAILLVVGIGFFGVAVYFAWREILTAPMAALATGLCGLLLSVIVVLFGRLCAGILGKRKRRRQAPAGARGLLADLGMLAGEEIGALARAHVHGTLAASLVAGFAVGASPGLRRLLRDLLEI